MMALNVAKYTGWLEHYSLNLWCVECTCGFIDPVHGNRVHMESGYSLGTFSLGEWTHSSSS
jgi:hypothetical protein